jgi:hypothetical protein
MSQTESKAAVIADTPKPDRDKPISDHANDTGRNAVSDAIRHGNVPAIVRHLRETGDPISVDVAALLEPDAKASTPDKLELKHRRRGRPRRNAQNAIADKVRAATATGAKLESQITSLKADGVSRPTALRYRKDLGLSAKK